MEPPLSEAEGRLKSQLLLKRKGNQAILLAFRASVKVLKGKSLDYQSLQRALMESNGGSEYFFSPVKLYLSGRISQVALI